jgi:hypothetical protein
MAASSIVTQGLVNAAANINHCYASVKLWLLLERTLSQNPQSQGGQLPVSRAGPFVIWNELWPPFLILINAHEAEVLKGQNAVRTFSEQLAFFFFYLKFVQPLWSAISSAIADLFQFLKEFHSVLALETAAHEATLSRLRASGQPDGFKSKV